MNSSPTAVELLESVEREGFSLTLELRGTSRKWITGKNLFMGVVDRYGVSVRDAYGPVVMEIPLRVGQCLVWVDAHGERLSSLTKALRNTIVSGRVRRNSHLYGAMSVLVPIALRRRS